MSRPRTDPTATRRPLRTALGVSALAVAALAGSVLPAAASAQPSSGDAGTRAQIPWSTVGGGWTLATWSPSTNPATTARASLFLVSPTGRRYLAAHVPAGTEPVLFSPVNRAAVIEKPNGTFARFDLRHGGTHDITTPHLDSVLGYADPRGVSLLVSVDRPAGSSGPAVRLEVTDATGRSPVALPVNDAKAGELGVYPAEATPDGTHVVAGAQRGLVVLSSRTGHITRRLIPSRRGCSASSWWSKTVALASCSGVLYTVPVSGAAAHRISLATRANPFGYDDAWRTGPNTPPLGLAENGCGPRSLVRFDHHGHGIRFSIPSPTEHVGTPRYVGHHGDTVTLTWNAGGGCQSSTATLFRYDARHHRSTAELGSTVNGGTVTGPCPPRPIADGGPAKNPRAHR